MDLPAEKAMSQVRLPINSSFLYNVMISVLRWGKGQTSKPKGDRPSTLHLPSFYFQLRLSFLPSHWILNPVCFFSRPPSLCDPLQDSCNWNYSAWVKNLCLTLCFQSFPEGKGFGQPLLLLPGIVFLHLGPQIRLLFVICFSSCIL